MTEWRGGYYIGNYFRFLINYWDGTYLVINKIKDERDSKDI